MCTFLQFDHVIALRKTYVFSFLFECGQLGVRYLFVFVCRAVTTITRKEERRVKSFFQLTLKKGNMTSVTVGILTVSDSCAAQTLADASGANLKSLCETKDLFDGKVVQYECVPDDRAVIKETLLKWVDDIKINLILTTGGTGFSERDVTPEAVKEIIEKEAPGIATRMITESLKVTPLAMLSRPVCGIRGRTLIATLPGSRKGSEECLRFIAPAVMHAVALLLDRKATVRADHEVLQAEGVKLYSEARHSAHHHNHNHNHHFHHHGHHHGSQGHHHHHHHGPHTCHHRQQKHESSGHSQESSADVYHVCHRPRKSPYPMISVEEAQHSVFSKAFQGDPVTVKMEDSLGFVLAQDVFAKDALPPFPASIKDGYAVVAADGAGPRQVQGDSTAGDAPELQQVTSGTCIRISTGAPLPPGADAVVQVEDTELVKEGNEGQEEIEIKILKEPSVGQDIRPVGCDIAAGEKVLCTGNIIGAAEMGLLASVGVTEVAVIPKPVVAVLSTGNELQEPDSDLKPGHIRDSNRTTLMALLKQQNIPYFDGGIATDTTNTLLRALQNCMKNADIVVTSGSVSMGERDILRPVLQSDFQAEIHFAQVFMKPGKPTTFATCEYEGKKKLILGLPGNPVSATVTSHLYLLPLCRKMAGCENCHSTVVRAKLSAGIYLDPRPEYHRATLTWEPDQDLPIATSTGNQLSSRLLSMAGAQALLKLPPRSANKTFIPEGTVVNAVILSSF
ncbi:gephyrin-like [Oratosquilla oratoria]|uniref:gephyrin-like n=1 Tax=Oratosquilla oratoria TaxID=337810 RepID=UPI003F767C10